MKPEELFLLHLNEFLDTYQEDTGVLPKEVHYNMELIHLFPSEFLMWVRDNELWPEPMKEGGDVPTLILVAKDDNGLDLKMALQMSKEVFNY